MTKEVRSLSMKFSGPLMIFITTLGGQTYEDFKQLGEVGVEATLFDYVGQAIACLFTNTTTCLSIASHPSYWRVEKFSPKKRILMVRQIGGEPLEIQEDDPVKLGVFLGSIVGMGQDDHSQN